MPGIMRRTCLSARSDKLSPDHAPCTHLVLTISCCLVSTQLHEGGAFRLQLIVPQSCCSCAACTVAEPMTRSCVNQNECFQLMQPKIISADPLCACAWPNPTHQAHIIWFWIWAWVKNTVHLQPRDIELWVRLFPHARPADVDKASVMHAAV